MWIETLKNGKFRAVERYTDPLTQQDKKVSVTFEKNTAAQRKLAAEKLYAKIQEKTYAQSKNISFGNLVKLYLEDKKHELRDSSYDTTQYVCYGLIDIIGASTKISALNAGIVRNKLLNADTSTPRKNTMITRFKSIMSWAYKNDFIDNCDWIKKIDRFKVESGPKEKLTYLESDQLQTLLNAIKEERYRDLAQFLALTGLRIGEALALSASDIDLKKRTISITKTFHSTLKQYSVPKTSSSYREIYIQNELLPLAKKLKANALNNKIIYGADYIFQHHGKQMLYRTFSMHLQEVSTNIGMRISPHGLRHTHTALLAENDVPIDEISRRLGHEDSEITRKVYYHVTQKQKDKEHTRLDKVSLL